VRATRIEIRTKALRAGRTVSGAWEPAGQLITVLYCEDSPGGAAKVVEWLNKAGELDGEDVIAVDCGRVDL